MLSRVRENAVDHVQRRTLATLVVTQVLGGIGLSAGVAVGALLAEDIAGSATYAGLGGTFQVLGTALLAIPMTSSSLPAAVAPVSRSGMPRPSSARSGSSSPESSATSRSCSPRACSSVGPRRATTRPGMPRSTSRPPLAARQLSLAVWVTTIGSVLGPNPSGPVSRSPAPWTCRCSSVPTSSRSWVWPLATPVMLLFLRPDPLLEARRRSLAGDAQVGPGVRCWRGLRILRRSRVRLVALLTLAVGHAVMVSVMVMTPCTCGTGTPS